MTGALKRVGEGQWAPDDVSAALEARDRARCPGMAPSSGLCLIGVDYPSDDQTDAASGIAV